MFESLHSDQPKSPDFRAFFVSGVWLEGLDEGFYDNNIDNIALRSCRMLSEAFCSRTGRRFDESDCRLHRYPPCPECSTRVRGSRCLVRIAAGDDRREDLDAAIPTGYRPPHGLVRSFEGMARAQAPR